MPGTAAFEMPPEGVLVGEDIPRENDTNNESVQEGKVDELVAELREQERFAHLPEETLRTKVRSYIRSEL